MIIADADLFKRPIATNYRTGVEDLSFRIDNLPTYQSRIRKVFEGLEQAIEPALREVGGVGDQNEVSSVSFSCRQVAGVSQIPASTEA